LREDLPHLRQGMSRYDEDDEIINETDDEIAWDDAG